MDDTRILFAIKTLHIRFMEAPTERAANHIREFIRGSCLDIEPPTWITLAEYDWLIEAVTDNKFDTKSMAHLQTVAEEIFEVSA